MAIAEITSALSATSSAIKLLKNINDASKTVEINSFVLELQLQLIDLNGKILSIQGEFDQLTNEKKSVEEELRQLKEKEKDRSNYELAEIDKGAFVYEYIGTTEPDHYLCASCFKKGAMTILRVDEFDTTIDYYCSENTAHCITTVRK